MWAVRVQGQAVDPLQIPINVVDPDSRADGFLEGVHFVPDTIDYIRDIGHLAEKEEDLIGERPDSSPSATLDEEFAENEDSPLDDLDADMDDSGAMEGMEAVNVGGEQEEAEAEADDD